MPQLSQYMVEKGISYAGRELYIQNYLNEYPDSVITKIYNLPLIFRIPLGFLFFIFLPYLSMDFYVNSYFDIRKFLLNFVMPLLSIFYLKYLVTAVVSYSTAVVSYSKDKNNIITFVLLTYFIAIFFISQFSLQYRHKTMVMPLFYVAIAYFYYYNTKLGRQIGSMFIVILLSLQIINLF